jgi:excisionase family DNA binding protein
MKEYMTTKECGRLIGRSAGAIRNLVLRRQIPFRKLGGRLLFLRSEIEQWIDDSPGLKIKDLEVD